MTTPAYQGPNQPPADRGGSWLGSVGTFFGGSVPQYAAPPSVKPPEQAKDTSADAPRACVVDPCAFPIDPAALAAGQIAIVIPRSLISAIDPAALAAGQIAIVIPRSLVGCEPAQGTATG